MIKSKTRKSNKKTERYTTIRQIERLKGSLTVKSIQIFDKLNDRPKHYTVYEESR